MTTAYTIFYLLVGTSFCSADVSETTAAPDGTVITRTDELTREERFPSVEERVKLYMGNWYVPPCDGDQQPNTEWIDFFYDTKTPDTVWRSLILSDNSEANRFSHQIESVIEPDKVFFLEESILMDCLEGEQGGGGDFADRVFARKNMQMYCFDAAGSLSTALKHVQREETSMQEVPTLIQFGDLRHSHVYGDVLFPHFKKFRSATTPELLQLSTSNVDCVPPEHQILQTLRQTKTPQPIVWKFATARHFRILDKVYREDTPWDQKKPQAVFRGQLTGSLDGYKRHAPDEVNCMNMRRCRLVYQHHTSPLIDAKLTSTRNRIPGKLNGVKLLAPVTTIRRLLEYKAIIMLEGNDVASGLKWALLSQSVVLMPKPLHTSWAME
jgi:hypothetical protein